MRASWWLVACLSWLLVQTASAVIRREPRLRDRWAHPVAHHAVVAAADGRAHAAPPPAKPPVSSLPSLAALSSWTRGAVTVAIHRDGLVLDAAHAVHAAAIASQADAAATVVAHHAPARPGSGLTFCGSQNDVFQPHNVTLRPDPPKRGANLTVVVNGVLSKDVVDGATAHLQVRLGLIRLVNQQLDVCEEVKKIGEQCPFKKGPLHIEATVEIPWQVPPGRYLVDVTGKTVDGDDLTCVHGDFVF